MRIPADLSRNRISLALAGQRERGAAIIDLTDSNPTRVGLLPHLSAADLMRPLADPRGARYDPAPRGLREAREAVAGYYRERGLSADPERIILTASTSESYAWIFQLLCDVGEEVLHPQPSYPLLGHIAGLCAVNLAAYPLCYEGRYCLDIEALRTAVTPRTRAVVVVSPNNPTGSCLRRQELSGLLALCRARRLCLIVDEVFSDYMFPSRHTECLPSLIGQTEDVPCLVLSGFSKVLGLPQLKLGWIHVDGEESARALLLDRLELIADTFLSVGTPVQLAAAPLLERRAELSGAILERVCTNRALLAELLSGSACQLLGADGGWCAVLRVPRVLPEEEWVLALLQRGVLCHPGYFFDFPDEAYLVLSLLPSPELMCRGVEILRETVTAICA